MELPIRVGVEETREVAVMGEESWEWAVPTDFILREGGVGVSCEAGESM